MDFPSRDEARVYLLLQPGESVPVDGAASARARRAEPEPEPAPPPPPPPPPRPCRRAVPLLSTAREGRARRAGRREALRGGQKGFENDSFDRRAMSKLIRTGALMIRPGPPGRRRRSPRRRPAGLKSLFELRKTARTMPPPVCRKHRTSSRTTCASTRGAPLRRVRAAKQFGGTTVRVCDHCGGNARTSTPRPATCLDPRPGPRLSFASPSGNSSAVERHLAKVEVAGSIPVSRSNNSLSFSHMR